MEDFSAGTLGAHYMYEASISPLKIDHFVNTVSETALTNHIERQITISCRYMLKIQPEKSSFSPSFSYERHKPIYRIIQENLFLISKRPLQFSRLFKIFFNRQIMKETYSKTKRSSQPYVRSAVLPPSRPNHCQPKPQPNIVHLSQYAHPRRDEMHYKQNRLRENNPQPPIKIKPNVLLKEKDQRRSHQSTHEDPMRRTQKKMRSNKGRTQWVAIETEQGELGCREILNPLHRQGLGQNGESVKRLGTFGVIQVAETGGRRMGEPQLLDQFQRRLQEMIWKEQSQKLIELVRKQEERSREGPADYFFRHPQLKQYYRARVLNWMMILSSELQCRRQTLANAITILDRFLSISAPFPLSRLQLLATGCMLVAQKLQDNCRIDVNMLWKAIEKGHTKEELLDIEMDIVKTLGFNLRSPTINCWANRLCTQWDLYVLTKDQSLPVTNIRFKSGTPQSYKNFRMMVEFIDFSMLDIQTRQYKNRTLAAAFLFLTVLLKLQIHTPEEVATNFRSSSHLVLAQTHFNQFFSTFLMDSFGFPLADILPAVQYASVFVVLTLGQKLLDVKEQGKVMSFEEYCGIQTYNQNQWNDFLIYQKNRQPW